MYAWFERAIFLSWFCAKPTCKFCYMHSIRNKVKQPRRARRRLESILAEALICKACGWEIGFVSAGISSWPAAELKEVLEGIHKITGKKQWLNLGALSERQIKELLPQTLGLTGTVETVMDSRDEIVPDKPIDKIDEMFQLCDMYNLKKTITIIIGLGEAIEDYPKLYGLIKKWSLDRINFYRLIPHENTPYKTGPSTEYYTKWISRTRKDFPKILIVAGTWADKTAETEALFRAGANAITKLPAIKYFGSRAAKEIEEGARKAGKRFRGTLTKYPDIDVNRELSMFDDELKKRIINKYNKYYRKLK